MKTHLRILTAFFFSLLGFSFMNAAGLQLWTTMNSGGTNNLGVIYNVNADGTNGSVAVTFNGANGANPSGNLVQGAGSKLYGTTTAGGNYNYGVIFSYDPSTSVYTVLHHFDRIGGCAPRDLLLGADGKLYGTTETGGIYSNANSPTGLGTLYCFDPVTNKFAKLIDFNAANGENPQGVMQAKDGRLYGMTRLGGDFSRGVLYSYSPANNVYRKLHSFSNATGEMPTNCKLIQATDGKLYGMTTWGGAYNMGTIFSFDLSCGNIYKGGCNLYTKLYDFNGSNGAFPTGTLLQASNGQLYGLTTYGGANGVGMLFSYNIATANYTPLHSFDDASGKSPFSGLIEGSDNVLYGLTSEGGANNLGVIFNFDIINKTYSVVNDCDSLTVGARPNSDLLEFETTPTGIRMFESGDVTLCPNPVMDYVVIKPGQFKPDFITIYDVNGQSVLQTSFSERLDIASLSSGIYFIEVKNANNFARARVVKL